MADTALSISFARGTGEAAVKASDFTIGSLAPGAGDFELRLSARTTSGRTMTRVEALKALNTFRYILMSGAIFTTNQEG